MTIKKGRLRWTDHAMRRQNLPPRTVLKQNSVGKRHLGRAKLRLERWKIQSRGMSKI